jgi:hypothetical protein
MMKFNEIEEYHQNSQGHENQEKLSRQSPEKFIGRKRNLKKGDLSEVKIFL